jgi:hypothetical protein
MNGWNAWRLVQQHYPDILSALSLGFQCTKSGYSRKAGLTKADIYCSLFNVNAETLPGFELLYGTIAAFARRDKNNHHIFWLLLQFCSEDSNQILHKWKAT